jgi:predicted transcriptional regulator
MAKVTFTVDEATVRTLRATAERLGKPQSMIVREAVAEYGARVGRLAEAERRRMLTAIDEMMKRPATRPKADVTRELREIRRARRDGGRRHRAE